MSVGNEDKKEKRSLISIAKNYLDTDKKKEETEFLASILEVTETPPSPVGRMVLWTIIAFLIVGMVWLFVGEVDEVAVARGKIVPSGSVKTVQSSNKGIIKDILVEEGQAVKKGDVLVVLDTTKTQADVDALKKQVAFYSMTVDRLQAEMNDAPFVVTESELLDPKDISAQKSLYSSRRIKLESDKTRLNAVIAQQQASIASGRATQEKYNALLAVAREKEAKLNELYRSDAVSYFQLLEARQTRVDYQKSSEAMVEEILKAEAQLAEANTQLANVINTYKQETMTQLVEAKRQLDAYKEELRKANQTNEQSTIVATDSGEVDGLSVYTIGGVVAEGQTLMNIVPEGAKMEVEAYVDNKDIGFVRVGQEAEVKVDTFNFQKFGMLNAEVTDISADATEDQRDAEKDKKYRVTLSLENDTSGLDLTPGMNVTSEIKIKKKRIVDFFLDPFRQYMDEALRER
ncbi:MAG: HlyD family type I secretion periplasmic adaptor subunit [Selenomonadaceae bacterium]|nr:HlyD family type I secretion periplasmic adaptor subunit [Selenomonadaceae bacterium]MBP3721911.1 HlyD family type I secretion periplasmic adaptor subunit [Selenomonadaceae bacterium]